MSEQEARKEILKMVTNYYYKYKQQDMTFHEGDRIPYAGRVFDEHEMCSLVDSALDFWLTSGRYAEQFEKQLANFLNVQYAYAVNSGSSANLLAFMALTSLKLGYRRIKPGDEIITVAAAFPTTVAPIIQFGAVPVFVDVTIPQYNINVEQLESAYSEKTKAVMIAHTLGNPFDITAVKAFCDKYKLWLIEDNCDALGSRYTVDGKTKYTGTFGDIGTSSFYPPHHMTMGEGGCVYTNDALLSSIILSMRDWGRDCRCPSGVDNLCGNRFAGQYGELPKGYDHKYVYSHFGYNLKITEMQAAIGLEQLKKLPNFIKQRNKNWKYLKKSLSCLTNKLILPEECPCSNPSWFGFLITCQEGIKRDNIITHIERSGIQTRMLFAGNLINHPCFDEMRKTNTGYRTIGNLSNTQRIMQDSFWIGVYPGMTEDKLHFMVSKISEIVRK